MTTNMQRIRLIVSGCGFLLLVIGFQPVSYASNIMCWMNKQGVRECGAMVPPEYAQQRIEVINDKGQIVKVFPRALTPKELEAARQAEKQKEKELQRERARKRQDMILLRTFTTERDIEMSRKSKVDAIKGIIDITNSNTRTLEKNLHDLQKKAANSERSGEKPSAVLIEDMGNLRSQIHDNNDFVAKKQQAIIQLEKKYDNDLQRYRELKKVRPR